MPYFEQKTQEEYTRQFDSLSGSEVSPEEDAWDDDGFDLPDSALDPDALDDTDDPEAAAETDPELQRQSRQRKYRIAAGIGDLSAVLIGVAVILALVAFLISMLRFVASDFSQTFSLWQVKF